MLFSAGMAALCAVLEPALGAGDVLVAVKDGYPGVRGVAADRLAPRGVEVRLVPTDTAEIVAACDGATMVWIESPSNPGLDVADIAAVAEAAHAAGGRLAVDNTLCTPLGQRPLDLGADAVMQRHQGALRPLRPGARRGATRDPDWAAALRKHRSQGGAIAGPFEAWMLHRSLPTLALRLGRQSANAAQLAGRLRRHPDVRDMRHPSGQAASAQMTFTGPLVGFTLAGGSARRRSWPRSSWSRRRRPSAACTRRPSGASGGDRRGRAGLHPLLLRLRGRRGPARRRRAGAGPRLTPSGGGASRRSRA